MAFMGAWRLGRGFDKCGAQRFFEGVLDLEPSTIPQGFSVKGLKFRTYGFGVFGV